MQWTEDFLLVSDKDTVIRSLTANIGHVHALFISLTGECFHVGQ
jgi:hypothetical protein